MVGGRSRKNSLQYCRLGEPAIANHLPCHEMHHHLSADASDAKNRAPGRPWPTSKFARVRSADAATVDCALLPQQQGKMHEKVRSREKREERQEPPGVSEHATSNPTPVPPLVTVRAGT